MRGPEGAAPETNIEGSAEDEGQGVYMKDKYMAVEVSEPGVLRVVERQVSEPGAGQVRIRVEACGICHTDAATVTGTYPGLTLPRVPGHEVVGRIEALGSGVSKWKIGQRVGVGLIAGEDGSVGAGGEAVHAGAGAEEESETLTVLEELETVGGNGN